MLNTYQNIMSKSFQAILQYCYGYVAGKRLESLSKLQCTDAKNPLSLRGRYVPKVDVKSGQLLSLYATHRLDEE